MAERVSETAGDASRAPSRHGGMTSESAETPAGHAATLESAVQREQYRALTRLAPFLYAIVGMTGLTLAFAGHAHAPRMTATLLALWLLAFAGARGAQWFR